MSAETETIAEEFNRELSAIGRLLAAPQTGDEPSEAADVAVRMALSNACALLLAALFEEFVRELVKEYCAHVCRHASSSSEIPPAITAAVWDRSIYILRGLKFGRPEFNLSIATNALGTLSQFCMAGDLSSDVAGMIAYNNNNMKPKEINEIFKRVGINDWCGRVGKRTCIAEFFGSPSPGDAHSRFVSYLGDFYNSRNEIAHAIGSFRGIGSIQVLRHVEFFRVVATAFTEEIDSMTR